MSSKRNGGTRANQSGQMYESVIESVLVKKGFAYVPPNKYFDFLGTSPRHPVYTSQIRLPNSLSIYGDQLKHDFVVYHPDRDDCDLIIEVKWQASTGSVYEKYPYVVANIAIHPFPTIVVLDGRGYKPGAEAWLREQATREPNLYAVMDTVEFIAWANGYW